LLMDLIRVLIVDDEPLARDRVRQLLDGQADIEVIGECGDGTEALEVIRSQQPDVVFLDVQMPELDGFGLLRQLDPAKRPIIIFVTAYDRFALKAFEVHALDYLLKPFDPDRFQLALERARQLTRQRRGGERLDERLTSLLADLHEPPKPKGPDRIAVKSGGRVVLIRPEDVDWVESADNYVNLHVGKESHLLRETMNALEERLPAQRFLRISRSVIVNLDRIRELQPLFHGEYAVILCDGTRLTLSRGYRDRLGVLMGKGE
jgi:two-component system, LytTR family, response regulator